MADIKVSDWQLYRHFDATGDLLYAGISHDALTRLTDHKHKASWFRQIRRIDVEHFASRKEALAAEKEAIRSEKPLHNRTEINAIVKGDVLLNGSKRKYTRVRKENSAPTITQKRLKELLLYHPKTGRFTWRINYRKATAESLAGNVDPWGYWRITIEGRAYRAHQLAWLYVYGEWSELIDHRNRVRSANWIDNLRKATTSQNMANVAGNNQTGFKGVMVNSNGKFGALIRIGNKRKYLGTFDTAEEASIAYQEAALKQFGEFASE